MARPVDLPPVSPQDGALPPVPRDDWDREEAQQAIGSGQNQEEGMVKSEVEVKQDEKTQGRGKGHSERTLGLGDFKTPPSRNRGEHGSDQAQNRGRKEAGEGSKTEGPMPLTPELDEQDSLEAALGEEITLQLWEENVKLRAALQKANEDRKKQSTSSWSEVSVPPKEMSTPRRESRSDGIHSLDTEWNSGAFRNSVDEEIPQPPPVPPLDKKNDEWWTRPVHRYGEFRGLQTQADLRQAAAEVNLRDEVRRYGRAEHLHHEVLGDGRAAHLCHGVLGDDRADQWHHGVCGILLWDGATWVFCNMATTSALRTKASGS